MRPRAVVETRATPKKSATDGELGGSSALVGMAESAAGTKRALGQSNDYDWAAVLEPASVVGLPFWTAALRLIAS